MKTFEMLEDRVQAELQSPDDPDDFNFWIAAQDAKDEIAIAVESGDAVLVRSAAAAYGGLIKRWKRLLIEELTEIVFQERDTSRDYVRAWQKRVFGQAIASERLAQYAKPHRSGGGRAALTVVPEYLETKASDFFSQAKDRIKSV